MKCWAAAGSPRRPSSGPVALRYLAHTVWPAHLAFYYGVTPLTPASLAGWGAWLLAAVVIVTSILVSRERRCIACGWLLGFAALLPALNLIAQPIPMTDHYQHWALPGWILALTLLIVAITAR